MMRPSMDAAMEGVIVLSHSLEVLHISPLAKRLIQPLLPASPDTQSNPTLPDEIRKIGVEIRHAIQDSLSHGKGLSCGVERTLTMPDGTCFVRGVGFPARSGSDFLTIIVLSNSPIPSLSTHWQLPM